MEPGLYTSASFYSNQQRFFGFPVLCVSTATRAGSRAERNLLCSPSHHFLAGGSATRVHCISSSRANFDDGTYRYTCILPLNIMVGAPGHEVLCPPKEEMSDTEDEVLDEEQEGEEPLEEANEDGEVGDEEGEEKGEEREEEEGEEEEPEKEEPPPHVPLTEEMLREGLSLLCKTGNGLAHAYVKLEVKDKELTDISVLESFIHLRYVDLSQNSLRDLSPLRSLTHLLSLRVDQNQLTSVSGLGELPYLQQASLAQNRIQNLQGIAHPRLESLNLIGNELRTLESLDCSKLNSLHTLELRGNKLHSTAGLYLPNLRELYLAQNNIKTLEGLENLVHLTSLHLRDNQLETLDGFSANMQALQYLNLRGNLISRVQEVEKLKFLPMLRALVLRENPCEEEDGYRLETLISLPHLERLDKDFFEEEERTEAAETQRSRMEDGIAET